MKTNRAMRWLRELGATRSAALAVGAGLAGLGLDAAIAHFAGREMKSVLQLVPVVAGTIGFVALSAAALRWRERSLRLALRIAGAVLAAVGLIGTALHGRVFLMLMDGQALTLDNLEAALYVAPPLAAPGAFIAIGGLLVLLASPMLSLRFVSRGDVELRLAA